MNLLKTLWPTPFKVKPGNILSLVVQAVIFVIICAVIGILIGILAGIPIVGIIFAILGSLMELYSLVGLVLCILKFFNVVK